MGSRADSLPAEPAACGKRAIYPIPPLAATHGVKEVGVVLCTTELIDEKFGRFQFVHGIKQFAQHPYLLQDFLLDQQFLSARAGAVDVDRGIDPFLGHAAVEMD